MGETPAAAFGGEYPISSDGNTLTAWWQPFRHGEPPSALIEETNRHLAVLKKNLPTPDPSWTLQKTRSGFRQILLVLPILLSMVGFFSIALIPFAYPMLDNPFLESLKYTIPAFLLYLFLLIKSIAGHSSSHKTLLGYGFLALISFPLAGAALYQVLNGLLDKNPPSDHIAEVMRTEVKKGKKGRRNYYAFVASWREGQMEEKIKITVSEYTQLSEQKQMTITTKPGFFGEEWIVNYKVSK